MYVQQVLLYLLNWIGQSLKNYTYFRVYDIIMTKKLPITTVKPTEDFKLLIQLYLHLKDWFIQTNRLLQALTTQTFQEI